MSTTAQTSTQIANLTATPGVKNKVIDNAQVKFARFDFAQSGAGDAGSTVDLVKLPSGLIRILPLLSYIKGAAFGTSRTLDVGYVAYTKPDGSAGSGVADAIEDGLDVSSATSAYMGVGTDALPDGIEIESMGGITVQAKVAGGTIPDTTTLSGWIAYVSNK